MPRQYSMGGRSSPGGVPPGRGGGRDGVAPPEPKNLRERVGALRNLPPFLRELWRTSPPLLVANLVLRTLRALLPVLTLYVGKLIIDEVVALVDGGVEMQALGSAWASGTLDGLALYLGLEFGLAVLSDLFGRVVSLLDALLSEKYTNATSIRLMEHAATLDLEDCPLPADHFGQPLAKGRAIRERQALPAFDRAPSIRAHERRVHPVARCAAHQPDGKNGIHAPTAVHELAGIARLSA